MRQRGVAMLLVLIAVAIATILSMSFLSSQATSLGVAQNVQGHAQARSVAESALVVAINYVQTDADWRTDKSEGQWVTTAAFNGGTFDLYAYDGLDTDGDGVVDDTDGDLADDDSDPVTIKVVADVDGVSHTVFAVVTAGETVFVGTVLYVVDSSGPTAHEQTRMDLIESWGFEVVQIGEDESAGNYDTAIADNEVDVVYVSTLIGSSIGSKLDDVTVGVVTEESSTYDALDIATGSGNYSDTDIDITDNTHYITSPFSTGTLAIMSSSSTLKRQLGTVGAGVSTLAEQPGGSDAVLSVLDAGDTGHDGSAAPGRRVALPWSGASSEWNVNDDGETIMQRSLIWAAVPAASGNLYDYATRTQGTDIWAYDGTSTDRPPTSNSTPSAVLSSGEYDDIDRDDNDAHSVGASSNGQYPAMRYVIQIDEAEAEVTQFVVTWIGSNQNGHPPKNDGVLLYIWNYTTGAYEQLDISADTAAEVTLTGTVNVNIGDYLGGASDDTVTLLAQSRDKKHGANSNTLNCDYVSLAITSSITSASGPQQIALYEFDEVTAAPVVVGQWKLDDVYGTYDYASQTQGTNIWAYGGQSSTDPPNSSTFPSVELISTEYDTIEADDASSHSVATTSINNYPMMRYVFEIDQAQASVWQIDLTWIGSNTNKNIGRTEGVELYIWNYSEDEYEQIAVSADTEAEVTLTGTVNANLSEYIGGASNDTITVLAQSRDKLSGVQDNILYNDYILLTINGGPLAADNYGDNDGTPTDSVTSGVTGMGDGGTAFHFNGVDDLVRIPADPALNFPDDFSLSGWFKLDNNFNSSTGTSQIIMSKYQSNNYDMLLVLAGNDYGHASPPDGSMVFKIEGGNSTDDTNYVWTNRTSWTAGQWYHFTAVLDSNYAPNNKIYINGVDDSGGFDNGVGSDELSLDFDADVTIGGGQADSGQLSGLRYFDGVIDEVRLIRQVLTDSQIAELATITEPTADTVPIAYDTSGFGAPLNLDVQVPSNVTWVPGGGLTFDTATRLISPSPATKLYDAMTATNQFSIEVQFTPANSSQGGPARIVSYSGGSSDTNFTFGQDGNEYITRLDTTSTTSAGTPSADSGNLLAAGVETHVIVSYDGDNITMYNSDGSSVTLARTGDFDWDNSFDLLMGNEAVDGYDWLGTLHRVAIYDEAFDQNQATNVFDGIPPGEGSTGGTNTVDWVEW